MAMQASCRTSLLPAELQKSSGSGRNVRDAARLPARSCYRSGFAGKSLAVVRATREAGVDRSLGSRRGVTVCGLGDFVGGDLIGLDLGQWVDDVETYGAIGFYAPPEGGAESRYGAALKYKGYHFMHISARGLGDPEAYLLKTHGVRPAHLGKQAVARFYQPGEVDYRLSVLPPRYKGIVLWVGEAKVLSKNELQFLAILPALRPRVKVVCEMGGSRKFEWKPLKDLVGLPPMPAAVPESSATPVPAEVKEAAKKQEAVASS